MNSFEQMQFERAQSARERMRADLNPEVIRLAEILEPKFSGKTSPQAQDHAINRLLSWQRSIDNEENISHVRPKLEEYAAVVLRAIYDLEHRSRTQRISPELEGLRSKLGTVESMACKILDVDPTTLGAAVHDELFDEETKLTFNL